MGVSREDRDSLLLIGVVFAMITLSILFFKVGKYIPLNVLSACILLVQYFYAIPKVDKFYYSVNDQKAGAWRWIPFVNEIQLFSPFYFYSSLVLLVLAVIVYAIGFVPIEILTGVMGEHLALNFAYRTMLIAAFIFIILNVVMGIGYCKVFHHVNVMLEDLDHSKMSKSEVAYYVLFLFPVIRCASLLVLSDKLKKLDKYYASEEEEQDFIEE